MCCLLRPVLLHEPSKRLHCANEARRGSQDARCHWSSTHLAPALAATLAVFAPPRLPPPGNALLFGAADQLAAAQASKPGP